MDTFLVIIGLLIIVGTVVCYLFYNLNSTTMYVICGIVLVIMVLLLYIRNYKNNHYGGKFKNDFPDEYSTHSEPHRPALRATRSIM